MSNVLEGSLDALRAALADADKAPSFKRATLDAATIEGEPVWRIRWDIQKANGPEDLIPMGKGMPCVVAEVLLEPDTARLRQISVFCDGVLPTVVSQSVEALPHSTPFPPDTFRFQPPPGAVRVTKLETEETGTVGREALGRAAFDFRLPKVGGGEVRLKDMAGKTALLFFWIPGPFMADVSPEVVNEAYKQLHAKGLLVYGIVGPGREKLIVQARKKGYAFPLLVDKGQALASRYWNTNVSGMVISRIGDKTGTLPYPSSLVVIGPDGTLQRFRDHLTESAAMRALLAGLGFSMTASEPKPKAR
jgi:peroxiredoxin